MSAVGERHVFTEEQKRSATQAVKVGIDITAAVIVAAGPPAILAAAAGTGVAIPDPTFIIAATAPAVAGGLKACAEPSVESVAASADASVNAKEKSAEVSARLFSSKKNK